jgi:hypothetical protein
VVNGNIFIWMSAKFSVGRKTVCVSMDEHGPNSCKYKMFTINDFGWNK